MSYEDQLKSFSNPIRRRAIDLLAKRPMSVRELTESIEVSQPVMSQHLKLLKDAGLVDAHSEGTRNIYCLNRAKLDAMQAFWTSHWSDLLYSLNEREEKTNVT